MKKIILIIAMSLYAYAQTAVIEIEGMTCPLCTTAIKHSLKKVDGVSRAKVRLNTQKATVTYDGNVTNIQLLDAVKRAGYTGKIINEKK